MYNCVVIVRGIFTQIIKINTLMKVLFFYVSWPHYKKVTKKCHVIFCKFNYYEIFTQIFFYLGNSEPVFQDSENLFEK